MTATESSANAAITVEQALAKAVALHRAGNLRDAEQLYRAILQAQPQHPVAHHNLGVVAVQMQQPPAAEIDALETEFSQGRYAVAEARARDIVRRFPEHGFACKTLGAALHLLGRTAEALEYMQRAALLLPDDVEAHCNCGVALKETGRLSEAETCYRRALQITPDYAEAHNNLGVTLKESGRLAEAVASYRRALQLKPDYTAAHNNLGIALKELGNLEEAIASYRRALQIKPDLAEAYSNLGVILKDLGRLNEAEDCSRQALTIRPDYLEAYSNLLFTLQCNARHQPAERLAAARAYGQLAAQKAATRFSTWHCTAKPDRLRIGMVSADLRNHPVGYFLEGVLAQLDPARIELIAYPADPRSDALTGRIKPFFSAWKPLTGLSDETAARLIHADGVHLLLDLSGHTSRNRLPVFAWKPAPLQASWLGYFATTGLAGMDYLLADATGVPEALRGQFTEAVWYLPDTRICFTAPTAAAPVTALPARERGSVTFGCFQNLAKVGDEVLSLWGEILAALPDARLRLQTSQLGNPATQERFRQRLHRCGIAAERVLLHGAVSRDAYLAAHAEVDLLLDTFPYPGGTTTCEALWMGVPTLTLAGNSLLERQGASIMTAAGLTEFVAAHEAEYVAKAVAIAGDLPKLAALRAGLRHQVLASPLFDAPRFARHFEDALWGMWEHRRLQ